MFGHPYQLSHLGIGCDTICTVAKWRGASLALCVAFVIAGCGGRSGHTTAPTEPTRAAAAEACPDSMPFVLPGATPGSCGQATLTGSISKRVNAPLEKEVACVPFGQPNRTAPRSATWAGSFSPATPAVESDSVVINWTTANIGKAVSLTPDPQRGVLFTISNFQGVGEQQWISSSGTLTVAPSGAAGRLTATLSPDSADGYPGTGVISMTAQWTC